MRKVTRGIIAAAVAITMTAGLPVIPFAGYEPAVSVSADTINSGTCGEHASWAFDSTTGTLTISGTGRVDDYTELQDIPWYSVRDNITSVVIENGIENVAGNAFYECEKLTSVSLPDSIVEIGDLAFGYCTGLQSLTIPGNVTSIRDYAFYYCSGLKRVTIPRSVTSIGEHAFSSYNTEIIFQGTIEEWKNI
ncbi:MAG: leucine-rich repeat domain-containing protein, partial [Oscillospiraceae bacterium]|nr:leucine-rich repeat domain-containing protein [Oscillospiraceae bacterium]